ncbi:glutaredoxin-like domain-containing protein [Phlyctema vagabunda]|uniref:Glutaredoxin-like protein n=1 Tax=Phlyctema vagabunda TaxID=108571 RepID=A0ABR4PC80_9HELO
MRPSYRLLQHACRITFFSRSNCSLCTNAKYTLSDVWDARPFVYQEIDVMTPEGKIWRDLYEFDTPVIHVAKSEKGEELVQNAAKALKLMHRFTADDVKAKMDAAEKATS